MKILNPFLAFSLIELLTVIVILSILIGIGFYNYFSYKEESYVTVDTFIYIKGCMSDLAIYCLNNPGRPIKISNIESCQPKKGFYGNVTLEVPNATCTLNGTLPLGYQIKAFSSISNRFYSVCKYTEGGIVCYITPAD